MYVIHFSNSLNEPIVPVYVNSFFATLNTRRVTRGRGTDAETATMPTFLMVGKITKRENQFAEHVYPPSLHAEPSKADMERSQQTALEVGIEQEVTVTRDSVSRLLFSVCFGDLTD